MKTRHFLTVAEKIEILDYHEKYKEISMRNLSAIFSQKYEKNVTKSVVHRITQQKLELRQPLRCSILKVSHIKFIYNFKYYLNARLKKLCSRQAIPKISREDYFLF